MPEHFNKFYRVSDILTSSASLHADRPAIIAPDRTWTYADLDRRASTLAAVLVEAGAPPGSHCGAVLENVPEHPATYFASSLAGLVEVPVNTKHRAGEIAYQLTHADVETIVVSPSMIPLLGETFTMCDTLKRIVIVPSAGAAVPDEVFASIPCDFVVANLETTVLPQPTVAGHRQDPYIIWYTSGTTGRPKGALHINDSGIRSTSAWIDTWGIGPEDRGIAGNMFHVAVQAQIIGMLGVGGSLVMLNEAFSMPALLEEIVDRRVTYFPGIQVMFALLDQRPEMLEGKDLSSVSRIGYGSSPTDPDLVRRSMKLFPGVDWYHMYGQTESNCGGCCLLPGDHPERIGSVGKPLASVEAISIQSDEGVMIPPGERGEVCIKGPTVMREYYKNPKATAETIVNGWLHTGDIGYIDADGYLWLVDRKKDVIIRGGENVYPAEVELALKEHPAVLDCAVVGVSDRVMGESPVAVVMVVPGADVTSDELLDHCRTLVARYKCPTAVRFVDELPRSPMGKVLRHEVRTVVQDLTR
ncbi:MAG: class I adenylate-forming enzyme family protein [Solirubrobacterales bacterium]